jgi:hypothetical protein
MPRYLTIWVYHGNSTTNNHMTITFSSKRIQAGGCPVAMRIFYVALNFFPGMGVTLMKFLVYTVCSDIEQDDKTNDRSNARPLTD